jgi:hypothetical protein
MLRMHRYQLAATATVRALMARVREFDHFNDPAENQPLMLSSRNLAPRISISA